MATPDKTSLTPSRNPHTPESKSWVYFGVGFVLLTGAAIALGVLLAYFLEKRPVNLRAHAFQWVVFLEKTLVAEGLPLDNVHRKAGEERHDGAAIWNFYALDLQTPEEQDPNRLIELIRYSLADKGLRISDGIMETARRELRLSMGSREFALVTVLGEPPPPPQPADLRPASNQVLYEAQQAIAAIITAPGKLTWLATEEMSDAQALWNFSAGSVSFNPPLTVEAFASALAHSFMDPNVSVEGPRDLTVNFLYMGKCCIELVCIPLPPESPPSPVDISGGAPAPESYDPYNFLLFDLAEDAGAYSLLSIMLPSVDELPLDSVEHSGPDNGLVHVPTPLAPVKSPRVAIILDDGGYGGSTTNKIIETLDPKLTLALLPNTPNVKDTAVRGAAKGFQIMLHMPMETHSKTIKEFPGQLNTNMGKEEIERLTADAIGQIPHIAGVNNHTGSKFTDNVECLTYFMNVVRQKGLFFVDSRTLGTSKAFAVAKAMGVRAGQRNIFLDHSSNSAKIRAAFQKLIERAKTHGEAIGIGHFRENTVTVLTEEVPKLKEQGITLVHVSELVQ
ncbi:MAG TPA: divergent polysaccharide deacetylase family protein [Candidatus Hydrogenedentes bacterium]|nr:divergent polysaccharide deacetylase family protein [Candidatus Hydrogenedentota bacterium]